jgi:hypothetical protein
VVTVSPVSTIPVQASGPASLSAGILSRTPADGYPIGPDPEPDPGGFLEAFNGVLSLEYELLTAIGGLLLLAGLLAVGSPAGTTWFGRSGRRVLLGTVLLVIPVGAVLRGLTWLATGDTATTELPGIVHETDLLSSVDPIVSLRSLTDTGLLSAGPHWVFGIGQRGRSILERSGVLAGLLAATLGGLRYSQRNGSRSFRVLRNGLAVVVVVLLLSMVLGPVAWLATGAVSPGDAIGSGRTGVTTSFESGSMQGWTIEEGTASVQATDGSFGLHIDGAVERSYEPMSFSGSEALVALDVDGPGTISVRSAGRELLEETVDGTTRWHVSSDGAVTVRVEGRGIYLRSVRVAPVIGAQRQESIVSPWGFA